MGTLREVLAWLLSVAAAGFATYSEARRGEGEQRCAETVERAVAAQRDRDAETLKIVVDISQGRR